MYKVNAFKFRTWVVMLLNLESTVEKRTKFGHERKKERKYAMERNRKMAKTKE